MKHTMITRMLLTTITRVVVDSLALVGVGVAVLMRGVLDEVGTVTMETVVDVIALEQGSN